MAKLTTDDINRMADNARKEINIKYGLDDDIKNNIEEAAKKNKSHKKKNSHKVTIRNNNKCIGKANVFSFNFKKMMLATGVVGLVVVSFATGRVSKETKNVNYVYNILSEDYFKEPTYNGIKYTIKSGENIWSIVKKYETDEKKVALLVEDIMRINKLYGKILRPGDEITLVGVPSSKLSLFDYTDNYGLLDPIVEVDVRIEFLNKVKDNLSNVEAATTYLENIDRVLASWDAYKYSYVLGEESDEFDLILTDLREVCSEASEFGYDYNFNKKAYPISVVSEYQASKTY